MEVEFRARFAERSGFLYHQPNNFHHSNPMTDQITMLGSDAINPYFHHVCCFTYPAPKKIGPGVVP
jgi:hypothetical protein